MADRNGTSLSLLPILGSRLVLRWSNRHRGCTLGGVAPAKQDMTPSRTTAAKSMGSRARSGCCPLDARLRGARDFCGQTNSAAVPLFGRLFPLLGRQNSAVWPRSGILVRRKWNQSLARSRSACEGPETEVFAVFPRRTGESSPCGRDEKPRSTTRTFATGY
jgi:hypothetical protein